MRGGKRGKTRYPPNRTSGRKGPRERPTEVQPKPTSDFQSCTPSDLLMKERSRNETRGEDNVRCKEVLVSIHPTVKGAEVIGKSKFDIREW